MDNNLDSPKFNDLQSALNIPSIEFLTYAITLIDNSIELELLYKREIFEFLLHRTIPQCLEIVTEYNSLADSNERITDPINISNTMFLNIFTNLIDIYKGEPSKFREVGIILFRLWLGMEASLIENIKTSFNRY